VKRHEPSGDEVELRIVEAGEQRAHIRRREHLKVRRVVLGLATEEKARAVLESVRVRHRRHERPAGT